MSLQQLHYWDVTCFSNITSSSFFLQPQGIDSLLRSGIGDFLKTLQGPDINVQRVALVTFNSAGHNKPSLIRDLLDTVLPHLYKETKVRKELIQEVDMGPFGHNLDDGLDIRKGLTDWWSHLEQHVPQR